MPFQTIGLSVKFDRECSIFAPLYKMEAWNAFRLWGRKSYVYFCGKGLLNKLGTWSGFKNIVWGALKVIGLGGSVQLFLDSALKQYGWFRSFDSRQSVDANGNPLPWYTYSFIFFLEPRLKPHFEVFEYGSGNSTRWYGSRVKRITAVEHDFQWVKQISPGLPSNSEVLPRELGESYIQAVKEKNVLYHIIVVDGRNRVKCSAFAVDYLTSDGVLILDNSERDWYQKAKDFLYLQGFKSIDFRGMLPIVGHESCSTVFYRPDNCLGI